eukprot:scaffold118862_cov45-Attheya_sp.AAC.1
MGSSELGRTAGSLASLAQVEAKRRRHSAETSRPAAKMWTIVRPGSLTKKSSPPRPELTFPKELKPLPMPVSSPNYFPMESTNLRKAVWDSSFVKITYNNLKLA